MVPIRRFELLTYAYTMLSINILFYCIYCVYLLLLYVMAHLWLIPASKMIKTVQLVTRNYQNSYNRIWTVALTDRCRVELIAKAALQQSVFRCA